MILLKNQYQKYILIAIHQQSVKCNAFKETLFEYFKPSFYYAAITGRWFVFSGIYSQIKMENLTLKTKEAIGKKVEEGEWQKPK